LVGNGLGYEQVIRAIKRAAAGGHNVQIVDTPGCEKVCFLKHFLRFFHPTTGKSQDDDIGQIPLPYKEKRFTIKIYKFYRKEI